MNHFFPFSLILSHPCGAKFRVSKTRFYMRENVRFFLAPSLQWAFMYDKVPDFPKKNGKPGAFCGVEPIVIYLQLVLPVLLVLVGEMAATWVERRNNGKISENKVTFCYLNTYKG